MPERKIVNSNCKFAVVSYLFSCKIFQIEFMCTFSELEVYSTWLGKGSQSHTG